MRAGLAVAACVCMACSTPTQCERTGICVTIEGAGERVDGIPPLVVNASFSPPVANPNEISSSFGPRWKESASRDDFHLGIDYFGDEGTQLFAIGAGTVYGIYPDGSEQYPLGGNVVVIEHPIPPTEFHGEPVTRVFALYLHTNEFLVAVGDTVISGQPVATMGKTGDTDFVHLHFETRVETPCSLVYQREHPDTCFTGYDPHVHPYLFVGGANADTELVQTLDGVDGFGVRYIETRGDLDLDVIETDFGALGFDERQGIDVDDLDNFDYGYLRIVPQPFLSTSTERVFDLIFDQQPSYLELRDIYGRGVRF
jgi:hypothetical protein